MTATAASSSPALPPPIAIRDLGVHYGAREVLRAIDLAIPAHGITAIVGPSGCGKSTFLTCLNRLIDMQPGARVRGRIDLRGDDLLAADVDLLTLRRRVGMVFQNPNPFPVSIRRNFSLPLREHGVAKVAIPAVIEQCLRDVGLWEETRDRLDAPAQRLSGGQQQRLCIARALALRPEVILFDEPCSALDPLSSGVVEECIRALAGRVTVVIVTHNLAQARRLADFLAVFWLRDGVGTVVAHGPADAVFAHAEDDDARRYLGGACC